MRDFVYIGSTPCEEECEQLGENYNRQKARQECRAFINQLRRQFGIEPSGAQLAIKTEQHDFGSYPEVVCYFEDSKPESVDYAFRCESDTPLNWDMQAVIELQPATSITNGYKL